MVGLVLGPGLYNWFFWFRFRRKMNPKKVLTGGRSLTGAELARKFRAAHHTTADLRKLAYTKLQRANSKLTISKLVQADERALGRARSQRFRDNDNNERCRKYTTLKLMRGDAPGSSVPLATYSATTEEAIVMRPTRRSSRWDVSHEYTKAWRLK